MNRNVQPELLDLLPINNPKALGSRRDLLRLNQMMRHPKILAEALAIGIGNRGQLRIVELGASDGRFLLEVAQRLGRRRPAQQISARLVDRHNLLQPETAECFHRLNWEVKSVTADVFAFLKDEAAGADIILANLFLHHFNNDQLRELLALAAKRTGLLIALEPRRAPLPLFFSRLVGLIGCNSVTRHDAVFSIEGGFDGQELSGLWPKGQFWQFTEGSTGWFSHLFVAQKPR
jgi:hypothetical protein